MTDQPRSAAPDIDAPLSAEGPHSTARRERAEARRNGFIKALALYVLPAVLLGLLITVLISAARLIKPEDKAAVAEAQAPAAVAAAPAAKTDDTSEIARLQGEIDALRAAQTGGQPGAASTADTALLTALSQRLERLEAAQQQVASAALVARDASALEAAARGSAPFRAPLDALEKGLNEPGLLLALRPLADKGVPSQSALALSYPKAAAKAHSAADRGSTADDPLGWLGQWFASVVSIRRTDVTEGPEVAAVLNRAEARLNAGDLAGAVRELGALPDASKAAMKPWLDQARDRLVVDETTHRITELSLSRLSQIAAVPATRLNSVPATSGVSQ